MKSLLKSPFTYSGLLILIIIFLGLFFLKATVNNNPKATNPTTSKNEESGTVLKGVTLSPKSYSSNDFPEFLSRTRETGNAVTWSGDWGDLEKIDNGAKVVMELSKQYGYEPIIIVQFFKQDSGALFRPLDTANTEMYKQNLSAFANKYKPKYIGIGIEINILYEKSPADFDVFVTLFKEAEQAVKQKSPATKVFTVFQLERLKGLRGGLFGGSNDSGKNHWSLLEKFPDADLLVFTTYPALIYKDPSEIPVDYYTEIKTKTNKSIGFTEIGWFSDPKISGWESSEEEQSQFIERFFYLTNSLSAEILVWSFMYDQQQAAKPFETMGLIGNVGKEKKAWTAWNSK